MLLNDMLTTFDSAMDTWNPIYTASIHVKPFQNSTMRSISMSRCITNTTYDKIIVYYII